LGLPILLVLFALPIFLVALIMARLMPKNS
jgi:hypothetical protein